MEMRRDPRLFFELGLCYSILQKTFFWGIFGLAVACCGTRIDDRMIEDSAAPASSETAMDEQNPCPSAWWLFGIVRNHSDMYNDSMVSYNNIHIEC